MDVFIGRKGKVSKRINFALGLALGIVIGLGGARLFLLVLENLESINKYLVVFVVTAASVLLYYIRGHLRHMYGASEFAFGVFIIFYFVPSDASDIYKIVVTVVGGLYVMVRGLDNIGHWLKTTRFDSWWSGAFGEQ
jgi:hypothetical protein